MEAIAPVSIQIQLRAAGIGQPVDGPRRIPGELDDDFTDADSMFRGGRRDSDESHGARGFRFPSFAIMAAKQGSDEDCIEGMAGRVGAKGFATATTARRGSDGTESWIACSDHSLTTCSRDAASARRCSMRFMKERGALVW